MPRLRSPRLETPIPEVQNEDEEEEKSVDLDDTPAKHSLMQEDSELEQQDFERLVDLQIAEKRTLHASTGKIIIAEDQLHNMQCLKT